jgi:hypothetical protein
VFLFVKAKYLRYSLFDLGIQTFFLRLDRLLVGYRKYLVFFPVIARLVLSSVLSITSILGIGDNYIATRLAVKVDGLFIANT